MSYVQVRKEATFTEWIISRANRGNALGPGVFAELERCLAEVLQSQPKSLVITTTTCGKTRPVALAGGDLRELATLTEPRQGMEWSRQATRICAQIAAAPFPVVMFCDGAVIGGGVEFFSCADIRLATTRSSFEFAQLGVGLTTGFGGSYRLSRQLGESQLSHALLTEARWSADVALTKGLVHEVFQSKEVARARIEKLTQRWDQLSQQALRGQKQILQQRSADLSADLQIFGDCWMKDKHRVFLESFIKKD